MRMRCPSPLFFFNNITSFTPVGPPPPPLRKLNKVPLRGKWRKRGEVEISQIRRVDIKTQFRCFCNVGWKMNFPVFLVGKGFAC